MIHIIYVDLQETFPFSIPHYIGFRGTAWEGQHYDTV